MKENMVAFRLGKDEREQLDRILNDSGLPPRSQSTVLRLAIPFVHRTMREGMALGADDRERNKPLDKRYEQYRTANDFDFFALGYIIGFRGEHAMRYRIGKAQGEFDSSKGKPSLLGKPLSSSSSGYAVGYFDGYHGGYLTGLVKGHADREEAEQRKSRLTLEEASFYLPPEGDPVFMSCFAVGYRTGYRSYDPGFSYDLAFPEEVGKGDLASIVSREHARQESLSFPAYQKGSLRGVADRDAGKPYNPFSGNGVEPEMDDQGEKHWVEGYHDGYQGGRAAGTLEGEADRNNGKPFRPPSGLGALSDFAFGYRTAYRSDPAFPEWQQSPGFDASDLERLGDDERHRLEHSVRVFDHYGFKEYEDGRALGMADRQDGEPAKEPTDYVAGYHAHHYSPFVSGYREGYGPANRSKEYGSGYGEGQIDRLYGVPAKEYRGDSLRDAGYRAGYHEDPSALRSAEPRAQGTRRNHRQVHRNDPVVVKKGRKFRVSKPDKGA